MASNPPTQTQTQLQPQSPTQNILPQVPPTQAAPAQSGIPASVKADQLFDSGGKLKWAAILAPLIGTGIGALVKGRKGAEFGAALGTGLSKGITAGIRGEQKRNVKEAQFAEQQRQGLLGERDLAERRKTEALKAGEWDTFLDLVQRMEFSNFITPEEANRQRNAMAKKRSLFIADAKEKMIVTAIQSGRPNVNIEDFFSSEERKHVTDEDIGYLNDLIVAAVDEKEADFFTKLKQISKDPDALGLLLETTEKPTQRELIKATRDRALYERETDDALTQFTLDKNLRETELSAYKNATDRGLRIATFLAADNQWSYQAAALLSLGIDKSPDQIKVGSAEEAKMLSRAAEMRKYTTEEKITNALLRWDATAGNLFPDSGMRAAEREKYHSQLIETLRPPSSNDPEGDTARNKFIGSQGWKSRIDQMIAQGKDFTSEDRQAMRDSIFNMASSSQHHDMSFAVAQKLFDLASQYVDTHADKFPSVRIEKENILDLTTKQSQDEPAHVDYARSVLDNIHDEEKMKRIPKPDTGLRIPSKPQTIPDQENRLLPGSPELPQGPPSPSSELPQGPPSPSSIQPDTIKTDLQQGSGRFL